MTDALLSHVVVPVADESDAAETCDAIVPRVAASSGRITAVPVIEKAGGAPDKASVEQRELVADEVLDVVVERCEAAGVPVETDVVFHTDVVEAILSAGREADASAIVFRPREGSRWLDLLTGDVAHDLVKRADRPVLVLPTEDDD